MVHDTEGPQYVPVPIQKGDAFEYLAKTKGSSAPLKAPTPSPLKKARADGPYQSSSSIFQEEATRMLRHCKFKGLDLMSKIKNAFRTGRHLSHFSAGTVPGKKRGIYPASGRGEPISSKSEFLFRSVAEERVQQANLKRCRGTTPYKVFERSRR
jgi:hypothetical protein